MLGTFGVDTLSVPGPTPRRMIELLRRIPPGSLFPDHDHPATWSAEAHLLAGLIDHVAQLTWVTAAVNSKRPPPRPRAVPRPGGRRPTRMRARDLVTALTGEEGVTG